MIASRIGGLPEVVRQGETGWLVRPGDIEALAEQIREVASLNETTSNQMSRTCEAFAEQFAMEKILALYVALYRELVKP